MKRNTTTKTPSASAKKAYEDWHWGLSPASVLDIEDPDLPDEIIECGRLAEIRFSIPTSASAEGGMKRNRMKGKAAVITLSKGESQRSHLAYDPNHPSERLYNVLPEDVQRKMKKTYFDQNPFALQPLSEVARHTGGRHGTARDYPNVMVKPIGICTAVIYATEKEGDGFSFYIHRLGEESGVRPCLCVSEDGRLWYAGGNYTSPTAGITD